MDPCPGREVISPLVTILSLESLTTSQPQANQLNQSNEDVLAQVDQFTQNYELESGHSFRVFKGNLKNNLVFWRSIGAPDIILSIIENGYRLPFISLPLAVKLRNNKSARIHADFVDQAVLELFNSDRVRMVNERPFIVNPLSVSVQPCGKKKLILDLRHVNKSVINPLTPGAFCEKGVSWTFWWFLGWILVKLPLIWSKMHLHHDSLAFLPLASRFARRFAVLRHFLSGMRRNQTFEKFRADYLNEVYVNHCLGLSCGLDVVSINNL